MLTEFFAASTAEHEVELQVVCAALQYMIDGEYTVNSGNVFR